MGQKSVIYKSLLILACLLCCLSYYFLCSIKPGRKSTGNMTTLSAFFIICACVMTILPVREADALFLPKRGSAAYPTRQRVFLEPDKRPFCNAFTGCGKKRSNLPALTEKGEEADESINSLLELSAEPAVEDLSRQIMSEAKIWEAIQEANRELKRRKQQSYIESSADDVAVAPKSATANCALPPCYI